MIDNVLCKDCVHSFINWFDYPFALLNRELFTRCKKSWIEPQNEFDPVTGNKTIPGHYRKAGLERLSLNDNRCGPRGKYWQPKNKKLFLTYLKRI